MTEDEFVALAAVAGWEVDICEIPQSIPRGGVARRVWSGMIYKKDDPKVHHTWYAPSMPELISMMLWGLNNERG